MRYRCVASPAFIAQWGDSAADSSAPASLLQHELLHGPAVIFNRKDTLQDAFLAQHLDVRDAAYPRHLVPTADAYETALVLGMGWGMMSEPLLAARAGRPQLQEVLPGRTLDVMLYWQHWLRESLAAQRLTQAVKQAGRSMLQI